MHNLIKLPNFTKPSGWTTWATCILCRRPMRGVRAGQQHPARSVCECCDDDAEQFAPTLSAEEDMLVAYVRGYEQAQKDFNIKHTGYGHGR